MLLDFKHLSFQHSEKYEKSLFEHQLLYISGITKTSFTHICKKKKKKKTHICVLLATYYLFLKYGGLPKKNGHPETEILSIVRQFRTSHGNSCNKVLIVEAGLQEILVYGATRTLNPNRSQ